MDHMLSLLLISLILYENKVKELKIVHIRVGSQSRMIELFEVILSIFGTLDREMLSVQQMQLNKFELWQHPLEI